MLILIIIVDNNFKNIIAIVIILKNKTKVIFIKIL